MGPKACLADFTRKWCSGSTKSFDLFRQGSSPFFLRRRGDFNPHNSLYQSDPLFRALLLVVAGGSPADAIGRARCQIIRARVIGRKFFQIKCMSWS